MYFGKGRKRRKVFMGTYLNPGNQGFGGRGSGMIFM
jgi:hypothetical protein